MIRWECVPALKFALILTAGIITGSLIYVNLLATISVLVIISICILIIRNKTYFDLTKFLLICLLIFLLGLLKSNIDFFITPDDSIKNIQSTQSKTNSKLIGVISEIPDQDPARIRFMLSAEILIKGRDTIHVSGDVIAEVRKNMFIKEKVMPPRLNAGDRIILKGKLSDPGSVRNPGEFDYKKYLELHNVYKIFYATGFENAEVISSENLNFFYQHIIIPAKLFSLSNIDKYQTGDEASFLKGLVTGERSDISQEMKTAFVNAGVMHLIAVSGLNVAYIIISLTLLLSLLRINLIPRTIIIVIFLIFYCFFTGSTASILRASIMGILVLTAFCIERRVNFFKSIGAASLLILIYDSKQLFDPGFILSFSATISMVIIFTKFDEHILSKLRDWNSRGKKITLAVTVLLFTSLSAQIGTVPITIAYFGKLSVISIIANIVAVPLANLSLALGFFQIITATFSEYTSSVISEVNNILLAFQIGFIKWSASLEYSYVNIPKINFLSMTGYYAVVIILLTIRNTRQIFSRAAIGVLTLLCVLVFNIDKENRLRVTFIDVGQGDCAVIQTPDDKVILVDCGRMSNNFESGERTIAPFLRSNGITHIDMIILTHLHNDHTGGVNYLLENFTVGTLITSGQKIVSPLTDRMDSIVQIKGIPEKVIRAGDLIDAMENLRMYFLFPTGKFVNENGYTIDNNLNNGSVAFILKYRELEIFFGGDIEEEGEKFLTETYADFLKTDVLKVSHHGSITSTSIPFIIKNKPAYAVISCGMFNKFNHPSSIVLNRMKNTGTTIYRTDLEAAVVMESDGKEIEFVDWK
ncbi:MAG: DNA internalization-related competence protein ComEC/Rec2 [bacterium]